MDYNSDSPVILKIKSVYPGLKPSERRVADYILTDTESFIYSNLAAASEAANVSEATFVRFAKALGFSGYRDMHIAMAASRKSDSAEGIADLSVDENTSFEDVPSIVINRAICAFNNLKGIFDLKEYTKAVEALEKTQNICVFGAGGSAYVGKDVANKFMRLGKFVQASSDPHVQVSYAVSMHPGDVAIGISHSGETQQTVEVLRLAQNQGARVICITNYEASSAAKLADIKLLTASYEKILQSETMVSRLSQLTIVDMLYLGLIQRNYKLYAPMIEKQNSTIVPMFFGQKSRNGGEKD